MVTAAENKVVGLKYELAGMNDYLMFLDDLGSYFHGDGVDRSPAKKAFLTAKMDVKRAELRAAQAALAIN